MRLSFERQTSGSVSRRRSSPSSGFGSGTGAGGELGGGRVGEESFGEELPFGEKCFGEELPFGEGVGGPEVPSATRSGRRRRLELRLIGIFEDLSVLRDTFVIAEKSDCSSSEVKSSS